jgi:hypothetical protein
MAEQTSKQRKPDATGAELFALWVEAGTPAYRDLAEILVERGRYKSVTGAFSSIGYFASRDKWQERKAKALDDAAIAALEEAARIDAASFLKTSKEIATRLKYTTSEHLDPLLKMRESVRKPAAKSSSVTITIEIRQRAEQIAKKYGVPVEDVIAEAEAVAAGAWDSWSPNS